MHAVARVCAPAQAGRHDSSGRRAAHDWQNLAEVATHHHHLAAKWQVHVHDVQQRAVQSLKSVAVRHGGLVPQNERSCLDDLRQGRGERDAASRAGGWWAGRRARQRQSPGVRLTHLQVDPSCSCSGILNWLCAVLPPGMFNAASPEVAHASATLPRERTAARSRLYTKVFPEPPGPSKRNARACVGAAAPCDAGDLMRRRARAAARCSPGGRVQRPQRS